MRSLQQISSTQLNPSETANENFEATLAATDFGIKWETTVGLTLGVFGGRLFVNGADTEVADTTVAVSNGLNYVERTAAGVVSRNAAGFTTSQIPLHIVTATATGIVSWVDYRGLTQRSFGMLSIAIGGSPSGYVLNAFEAMAEIIDLTGTMNAEETVTVPAIVRRYIVRNSTTGGGSPTAFSITVKAATGLGVIVPQGSIYHLFYDGTNVVRIT